jgi:hypothetical protein
MEFLTSRDLRLNPKQVWKRLRKDCVGVVTLNGKPQFILSPIEPGELEEMFYLLNQIRAKIAVNRLHEEARRRGLDKMTMEQIDDIIQKTRAARRK